MLDFLCVTIAALAIWSQHAWGMAGATPPKRHTGKSQAAATLPSAKRPRAVMRRYSKLQASAAAASLKDARQPAATSHLDAIEPNHNNCSRDEPGFLPAIAAITHSYEPAWVDEMKLISLQGRLPIVALISRHLLCMADSFLAHVAEASRQPAESDTSPTLRRQQQRTASQVQPVFLASLDKESLEFCHAHQQDHLEVYCVDMSGLVPNVAAGPAGVINDNAGFNTCLYTMILWAKPVTILHALHAFPQGMLFLDVDVVLHSNFLHWLQKQQRTHADKLLAGYEAAADSDPRGTPNTGIIFATASSLPLVEEWLRQADDPTHLSNALGEQDALFRCKHVRQRVEIIGKKHVGTCGEHGIYATHFNCQKDKILSMAKLGLWRPLALECQRLGQRSMVPL